MFAKTLSFLLAICATAGCASVPAEPLRPAVAAPAAPSAIVVDFQGEAQSALTAEQQHAIRTIPENTHVELRRLLPQLGPQMTVAVAVGPQVIVERGEGGASLEPGLVSWTLDPGHALGADGIIATHLRTTLFHEFHHQARGWNIRGGGGATSIMDAVVAEGMATVFAREYAGADVPWAVYPDNPEAWLPDLQAEGSLAQYMQWMFAHPDGRRWIGYRTGTWLADQAISRSGRSAIDLVQVPTAQIVAYANGGRAR